MILTEIFQEPLYGGHIQHCVNYGSTRLLLINPQDPLNHTESDIKCYFILYFNNT